MTPCHWQVINKTKMGGCQCTEQRLQSEYVPSIIEQMTQRLVCALDESQRRNAWSILIHSLKLRTGSEVNSRESIRITKRKAHSAIVELESSEELDALKKEYESSSIVRSQAKMERQVEDFWAMIMTETCPLHFEIELPDFNPFEESPKSTVQAEAE